MSGDRQSQPRALDVGRSLTTAVERLEHAAALLDRNPRPTITHHDLDPVANTAAEDLDRLIRVGIAGSVLQQVGHDPQRLHEVELSIQWWRNGITGDADAGEGWQAGELPDRSADQILDAVDFRRDLKGLRLQPGKIEQVIHQTGEAVRLFADDRRIGVTRPRRRLRERLDRRERRAQVVRQTRQHDVLQLIGLAQCLGVFGGGHEADPLHGERGIVGQRIEEAALRRIERQCFLAADAERADGAAVGHQRKAQRAMVPAVFRVAQQCALVIRRFHHALVDLERLADQSGDGILCLGRRASAQRFRAEVGERCYFRGALLRHLCGRTGLGEQIRRHTRRAEKGEQHEGIIDAVDGEQVVRPLKEVINEQESEAGEGEPQHPSAGRAGTEHDEQIDQHHGDLVDLAAQLQQDQRRADEDQAPDDR